MDISCSSVSLKSLEGKWYKFGVGVDGLREQLNPEDTLISAWLQGQNKERKKNPSLGERKACKETVQDYYTAGN